MRILRPSARSAIRPGRAASCLLLSLLTLLPAGCAALGVAASAMPEPDVAATTPVCRATPSR